jgi:hypothetical protein
VLALALAGGTAAAQYPARQPTPAGKVLRFDKPAVALPGVPVVPAAAQQPDKDKDKKPPEKTAEEWEKEDRAKYVKLPPLEAVFAFPDDDELERAILERLRQDEREAGRDPYAKYPKTVRFPKIAPVGGGIPYESKTASYPPVRVNYDALYVVHRRLHFEEKNAERYGWDLGIIQPIVSTLFFYKDTLLLPNSLASGLAYGFYDTNVGKCLPGSPTPYMLYPPGLTITGSVFEAVVITGATFIFP